jgi:hypothetical protein
MPYYIVTIVVITRELLIRITEADLLPSRVNLLEGIKDYEKNS